MKKTAVNIIRSIFVLIFFFSAITKLVDFNNTIYLINGFIGLGYSVIKYSLLLLIVFEIMIALLFATDFWKREIVLNVTLLLMVSFIFINVFMMLKGYSNCSCFGTMIESNPIISLIKNLFLVTGLLVLKYSNQLKPVLTK
jgi:uncharacterized membrane protein YphA (DoxX/SURF4 family)